MDEKKIFPWDIPDEIRMCRVHEPIDLEPNNKVPNDLLSMIADSSSRNSLDDLLNDFDEISENEK